MIVTQSTPFGDNPFHWYQSRARAYGKMLSSMRQIMHQLVFNPEKHITVVSLDKDYRRRFLAMAKHNHVRFRTTRVKPYGPNAWQFTIKSWEEI